jgi:FixJ family two-component response regulator
MLVLDLAMPGASGLELQRTLETRARGLPIVFLTGHGDIASRVQAMKRGASDFLTKPVDEEVLMEAVRAALERRRMHEHEDAERGQIERRIATLTARERQVLEGIVAGLLNKQIAGNLLTAKKTVKFHRANLMRKMGSPRSRVGQGRRAVVSARPLTSSTQKYVTRCLRGKAT